MMRRTLPVTLFVVGLLSLAYTFREALSAPPPSFTVTLEDRYRRDGGEWVVHGTTIRRVWRDGTWSQVNQPGGRELFQLPGHGVFNHWPGKPAFLRLSDAAPGASQLSMGDLRQDPNFAGEDTIRGFSVGVVRFNNPKGYVELYRAPGLQGVVLRQVTVSPGMEEVSEAVEVVTGEPAAEHRPQPPDPSSVRAYNRGQ